MSDPVVEVAGFSITLVGHEVSGDPAPDDPATDPPADRWIGYAVPRRGWLAIFRATR
jgi:hypothetical protein